MDTEMQSDYKPRNAKCGDHQTLGKARKGPCLERQRKCSFAGTLIASFQPPELSDKMFLLFKATRLVVIFYGSSKKRIHLEKCRDIDSYCQHLLKLYTKPLLKKILLKMNILFVM